MRITGLDPARVTPSDPKSDASANFAISPFEARIFQDLLFAKEGYRYHIATTHEELVFGIFIWIVCRRQFLRLLLDQIGTAIRIDDVSRFNRVYLLSFGNQFLFIVGDDNLAFANSEEFSWIREIVSSKELEVICEEIKSEIDAVGAESAAESFFVEQVQEEIPAERTLHFLLFQTDIDPYSRSVTD